MCAVTVPRVIKEIAGFKRLPLFSKEIPGVPLLHSRGINKRLMAKPHWWVGSFDLSISQMSCFGTGSEPAAMGTSGIRQSDLCNARVKHREPRPLGLRGKFLLNKAEGTGQN